MPLTFQQIKNLKPKARQYKLFDGGGLYILVRPNGSMVWRYKYHFKGREKTLTIGTFPLIPLAKARLAHKQAKLDLHNGFNPSQLKQINQGRIRSNKSSFKEVADEWYLKNYRQWSDDYAKKLKSNIFNNISNKFSKLPIDIIEAQDIEAEVIKVDKRGASYLAGRFLGNLRRVFNYAIRKNYISINPAQHLRAKDLTTAYKPKHYPSISENEVSDFFIKLNNSGGNKREILAIYLFALLFVRSKDLRMAKKNEFNLKEKKWFVPASRVKNKKDHFVPLCPISIRVIQKLTKLPGDSPYLLPQLQNKSKHMDENATNNLMHKIGYKDKMSNHGFRTLASTLLHEQGYSSDVIERQLSHIESNKIKAAYNRAVHKDDRIKMMDFWGEYLAPHLTLIEGDNNA